MACITYMLACGRAPWFYGGACGVNLQQKLPFVMSLELS